MNINGINIGDLLRCKDIVIFDEIIDYGSSKISLSSFEKNSILLIYDINYQHNKFTHTEYYEFELFCNMKYVRLLLDNSELTMLLNDSHSLFERI